MAFSTLALLLRLMTGATQMQIKRRFRVNVKTEKMKKILRVDH